MQHRTVRDVMTRTWSSATARPPWYERGVAFRLGRLRRARGPGIRLAVVLAPDERPADPLRGQRWT
ncbi:hypothetical protein PUR71_27825 [Streptomyces sp. SP17BM10]|uniref:hypothetical protein n=1 Tax=Streptomyces sp. SP17BM10 TaxID=3002530 RepID=UPI002E788F03|nr:hypothetical protein [Streptomyces sp. SP17BM10]MEE1786681.1 hypothetical protein [Streptomyces sp. SP17BM10]